MAAPQAGVAHTEAVPCDAAAAARLRAYTLMEDAQGDAHERAGHELLTLETEALQQGWPDVALLAAAGQAMYALLWSTDRAEVERDLDALVSRAQSVGVPQLVGLALALRGLAAAGRDDSAAVLADVGSAVALVDDLDLPALDRCTVLVVCAAAYNALSLWELVDELYDAASGLEALCEQPVQAPAVAVNRVLVRLEWATALFELGAEQEAVERLQRAAEAAELAVATANLPDLWQLEVRACRDALGLVLAALQGPAPASAPGWVDDRLEIAARHRAALRAAGDVEFLPLLDALEALSLHRLGRSEEATAAARLLVLPVSASSGARSFPAWVRSEVLSGGGPEEAVAAHREYGMVVSRARWTARQGLLAAARSKTAGERLSADHARLSRVVLLDPLTGLSNRRCFDAWRVSAPAHDRTTALLLIDMDSFKEINDVHGHAVGDEVLRRVGAVLAAHVRAGDMALRLGGDEFAVVLQDDHVDAGQPVPDLATFHRTATGRAEAIREAVARADWSQVAVGLQVAVSVGVAVAVLGPHHHAAADRLYREADTDLYVVKSRGGLTRA